MNFIDEDDIPLDPLFYPLYAHILEKMQGASNREIWAAIRKYDEEVKERRKAEELKRVDGDTSIEEEEDTDNDSEVGEEQSNQARVPSRLPKEISSEISLSESQFIKGLAQPRLFSTPYTKKSSKNLLTKSKMTRKDSNVAEQTPREQLAKEVQPASSSRKIYTRKAKVAAQEKVVEAAQNQKTKKKATLKSTKAKKVPEKKSKKVTKKSSTKSKLNEPTKRSTTVKKGTQNVKNKVEKKKSILKQKEIPNPKSTSDHQTCSKRKTVEKVSRVVKSARKGTLKYHQGMRELNKKLNKHQEDIDLFDKIGDDLSDLDTIPEIPDDTATSSSTISTIRSARSFGVSDSSNKFINYLDSDDSMEARVSEDDTSMRNRAAKTSEEMLKARKNWRKRPSMSISKKKVLKKRINLTSKMLQFEEDDSSEDED